MVKLGGADFRMVDKLGQTEAVIMDAPRARDNDESLGKERQVMVKNERGAESMYSYSVLVRQRKRQE